MEMGLGTVGKMFAVQEQGSEFGPQNLCWKKKKKQACWLLYLISRPVAADRWILRAGWLNILAFVACSRPVRSVVLMNKMDISQVPSTEVDLWHLHACTPSLCTHINKHIPGNE